MNDYNNSNSGPTTFLELSDEWILSKSYYLKQSTLNKYQYLIQKYLTEVFESVSITDINSVSIEKKMMFLFDLYKDTLSYNTIKTIFYVIKSIVSYGMHLGYLPTIFFNFNISKLQETVEIQTLSEEQERDLIKILLEEQSANNLGIILSLFTGIRLGEVCSLNVEDIDFDNKVMKINKTVQRIHTPDSNTTILAVTKPKSQKSNRTIPIPEILLKILIQYGVDNLSTGIYVLNKRNKPYEPRTLQYAFQRIMHQCNYNGFHFHCLRHTFATRCVRSGFDIKTLSEILGHSNVAFTMNRYVHSDIDEKRKQMKMLEKNWNDLMM